MLDFQTLIPFRVNNTDDENNKDHIFYPADDDRIKIAEEKLGFSLPEELTEFYNKIGYGFFWQKNKDSFDRLLSPLQVAQITLKEAPYEGDPDLEVYDDMYDGDKLLFFEINEGVYLAIDKEAKNGKNKIYYFDTEVFDSLESFINAFLANQNLLNELED